MRFFIHHGIKIKTLNLKWFYKSEGGQDPQFL